MDLTCCKHCRECETFEYVREANNGVVHSFLYCKGGAGEVELSNWYIQKDGYPYSTGKINGKRRLYHTLFKEETGMVIDHINGDRKDNRLSNLREVTPHMNTMNYHNKRTSKFPGVYYNRKYGTWHAQVRRYNEKNPKHEKKLLGKFNTELEAYDAYVEELNRQGRPILTDTIPHQEYLQWKNEAKQTKLEEFA